MIIDYIKKNCPHDEIRVQNMLATDHFTVGEKFLYQFVLDLDWVAEYPKGQEYYKYGFKERITPPGQKPPEVECFLWSFPSEEIDTLAEVFSEVTEYLGIRGDFPTIIKRKNFRGESPSQVYLIVLALKLPVLYLRE